MPVNETVLNDRDAAARIEAARSQWTALHEAKIRNEAGIAQTEAELAEALEQARAQFGTDDLDALRTQIAENYAANTKAVTDCEGAIASVKAALAAADKAEA